MNNYRRWTIRTLLLSAILIGSILLTNYIVDPLQFFRKAQYSPVLSSKERLQNPGLARNYDYDTIVLGTSVTENFSTPEINKKLNCNTLKLSCSGATLKEEALTANVALRTGKVKTVLWGIDFTAALGAPDNVRSDFSAFPFYLYDENKMNDIFYLLDTYTTQESFKALKNIIKKPNQPASLDMLNNWQKEWIFGKEQVIKDYNRAVTTKSGTRSTFDENILQTNLSRNVVSVIKEHPEIDFIVFYPPYSMAFYKSFDDRAINAWLNTKLWLFNELHSLPNVQIYDFQHNYQVSMNLDNYKDMMHYSETINSNMIDSIAAHEYLVRSANQYELSVKEFKQRFEIYDPTR